MLSLKVRRLVLFVAVPVALMVNAPAHAVAPTTADPKKGSELIEPAVEMTVRKQGWTIRPSIVVNADIKHVSEAEWICLDRVTLFLRTNVFSRDTVLLAPNTSDVFPVCLEKSRQEPLHHVFRPHGREAWEWMLSSANDRALRAEIEVRFAVRKGSRDSLVYSTLTRKADHNAPPPGIVLVLGTLVGVLLLRILKAVMDRSARGFFIRAFQGWTASSIIVLLSQASLENFPIALQVRDFPGAVLLGLLSSIYVPALMTFLKDRADEKPVA